MYECAIIIYAKELFKNNLYILACLLGFDFVVIAENPAPPLYILFLRSPEIRRERKIGLPNFSDRFSRIDDGFNNGFNDGFNDDFGDGLNNGPDDGLADNYADFQQEGQSDSFYSNHSESGDFPVAEKADMPENNPAKDSGRVDLRKSFGALVDAIRDRFSGKSEKARSAGVDSSDAFFAHEFDNQLDDGFVTPEENLSAMPEDHQQMELHESGPVENGWKEPDGWQYDNREAYPDISQNNTDYESDYRSNARPYPNDESNVENSHNEFPHEEEYSEPEHDIGESAVPGSDDSDAKSEGLLAALGAVFAKFRRRLPSFRPKVYYVPEPEYKPEQDGIQNPSLASDIQRILEEQNKPGETEQEYEQMRSYIRSVSTDTRIRPGDIRPPENIGEVRAAESELYDLIEMISNSNEQQRSRIGIYEKPPEEDPYNYRGINNDRHFYTDMDAFSFDMNPSYGFESEEKIDPGRKYAEMEYNRAYMQDSGNNFADSSQFSAPGDEGGFNDGFDDDLDGGFNDGFNDDLDDSFNDGFNDNMDGGFNDGFNDNMDDSFNDGFNDNMDGGFNNGFNDDLDGDDDDTARDRGKKGRAYENSAGRTSPIKSFWRRVGK